MRVDRRLLAILLGLSLLANLFAAGVIAGGVFAPHEGQGAGLFTPGRRLSHLSPGERIRFMQAMGPYRVRLHAARATVRQARVQVEADVAAPRYDPMRVAADFAALRQAATAQQTLAHTALVDALGRLSPASRATLVARTGGVGNAAGSR